MASWPMWRLNGFHRGTVKVILIDQGQLIGWLQRQARSIENSEDIEKRHGEC